MALTATERLIPIRVKITRAKKHLAELEAAAERYRDSYRDVAISAPARTEDGHTLKRLPIIHFDMLAIAGDVLHNLRSALDHVVYHLALVADPDAGEETLRRISFPVGQSASDYRSRARPKIEKVIQERALQFIDVLKPYKGGNELLWRLHDTNNIDKHRKLIRIGPEILCDGEGFYGQYLLKDDEPSFATVDLSKEDKSTVITGVRSLLHLQAARREALIPTLNEMVKFVDELVPALSPLLDP